MNAWLERVRLLFGNLPGQCFCVRWGWPIAFLLVIILALSLRLPRLDEGHQDEVHTIGRSLRILYTGQFNPEFFYHPSGTMYLCVFADILSLINISRDVSNGTLLEGGLPPLDRLQEEFPNPVQEWMYTDSEHELLNAFTRQVRFYFVLLIPLQILLLAYLGYHLQLLPAALAASLFLAVSPSSLDESIYVAVNSSGGFFFLLTVALAAYFGKRGPVQPGLLVLLFGGVMAILYAVQNAIQAHAVQVALLWLLIGALVLFAQMRWRPGRQLTWLLQLFLLGVACGLSVACKYNAGVNLLIPFVFAALTLPGKPGLGFRAERWLGGAAASLLGLVAGFTLLTPFWIVEFQRFVHDVLWQVYYFQTGHRDYNTFEPGLQMAYINLRAIADQYSWTGVVLSVASWIYLAATGFHRDERYWLHLRVLFPALLSVLAFYLLMSNQAVFFDRNFGLVWSTFFFLSAAGWWLAAGRIAERRGWLVLETQTIALTAVVLICLLQAFVIEPALFTREWWRPQPWWR